MSVVAVDRISADAWGVGWYPTPAGSAAYVPSRDEMARATDIAEIRLVALGIERGDVIIMACRGSEAVQFVPFEKAANRLGAAFSCLDGSRSDGQRLLALQQLLHPKAVLGIGEELALGLSDAGIDIQQLSQAIPVLTARPRARRRLADSGLVVPLWLHAGPAVAVECSAMSGGHLDERWAPTIVSGRLNLRVPASELVVDTGLEADVDAATCTCGSHSPRVRLTRTPDFGD